MGIEFKEILKGLILLGVALGVAPPLGFLVSLRPILQRIVFIALAWTTIGGVFHQGDWGLTLDSIDTYRGHARGYHFYVADFFALILLLSCAFRQRKRFQLMPPGLWIYLVFCLVSFLTIFFALDANYVCKAAFRCFKFSLVFIALFNWVKDEKNLRFAVLTLGVVVIWEVLIVFWQKYGLGIYQVEGTFPHQNALGMYAGLIGMVFLAVTLAPPFRGINLLLAAYLAAGAIVESTISRAAVAAFGLGTVLVLLGVVYSKLDFKALRARLLGLPEYRGKRRPNPAVMSGIWRALVRRANRRIIVACTLIAILGMVGVAMTYETIMHRFHQSDTAEDLDFRGMLNEIALNMVRDHPLGVGWNNFVVAMNPPYDYGTLMEEHIREQGRRVIDVRQKGLVESHYHLVLAETGYIGLFAFLGVLGTFLWFNVKAFRHYGHQLIGMVSLGILVGCTINYLQSTLEHMLLHERNYIVWMMLLGITAKIEWWRRQEVKQAKRLGSKVRNPVQPRRAASEAKAVHQEAYGEFNRGRPRA